ncbi:MAG: hypothetical protein ACE5E6_09325, partial [Phycisphaerae bacterium]
MTSMQDDHAGGRTASQGRRSSESGFRLFRYFVLVSLAAVAAILLLVAFGLNAVLHRSVVTEAELDAVHLSAALRDLAGTTLIRTGPGGEQVLVLDAPKMEDL